MERELSRDTAQTVHVPCLTSLATTYYPGRVAWLLTAAVNSQADLTETYVWPYANAFLAASINLAIVSSIWLALYRRALNSVAADTVFGQSNDHYYEAAL
ncbi:MAG: hypothetical protein JJ911_20585 [Rhizobiaceae bacterium]|nr:hypothetical protein [Rhizobiaceae bacterium]